MSGDYWISINDLFRLFLITQAGLVACISGLMSCYYIHRVIQVRRSSTGQRLLYVQLSALAASYCLCSVYIGLDLNDRMNLRLPVSYRTPVAFCAFAFGQLGLWFLLSHYYVRNLLHKKVTRDFEAKKTQELTNRKHD